MLIIYTLSMLGAVSYATVKIQELTDSPYMAFLIYLNFTLAVINYIMALAGYQYSVAVTFLTSAGLGWALGISGQSLGWVIYWLSFVQIVAIGKHALYRRCLAWLFK